ncbi:MAG: hypothetical protein KDA99_02695, partial [Planctomycetales bacterium]|nr:hypothetical protein [Planctomycetales bacterium]
RYMSPEQAIGQTALVDHRTDIYSLGLTLYEFISGRAAFAADSRRKLVDDIVRTDPVSLNKLVTRVPRDLQTILEKAMTKEASGRYSSAQQLADDLRRFLDHRTITARPSTPLMRASRFARRNPAVTGLLAVCCLLSSIVAVGASITAWQAFAAVSAATTRRLAQDKELHQRKLEAYARDMQLAQAAVNKAQWIDAERLLFKWVDAEEDLRGFEWYYLWDCCHPADLERSISHFGWAMSVAFSPDGVRMADVPEFSDHVNIWDRSKPVTNEPEFRLRCTSSKSMTQVDTCGGLLCASDFGGNVYIWDWNNLEGEFETLEVGAGAYRMAMNPSQTSIAVLCWDRATSSIAQVYDRATNERLFELPSLPGWGTVWFAGDDEVVVTVEGSNAALVHRISSGELVRRVELSGNITTSLASRKGDVIALALIHEHASYTDAWIELRSADTWELVHRLDAPGSRIRSLAFSRDDMQLAAGNYNGQVVLYQLGEDKVQLGDVSSRLLHDGRVADLDFSPDDKTLATAGGDRLTHLIALGDDGVQFTGPRVDREKLADGVAFGVAYLDDDRVCSTRGSEYIDFWNPKTGKLIDSWYLDPIYGKLVRLETHRGRKLLAAGRFHWPPNYDEPGRVLIWNYDTGEKLHEIDLPQSVMSVSMPFSPDGRYLAVCGYTWLSVIDTTDGTYRQKQFSDWVKTAAFSPDGKTLACAEISGPTYFFDVETLEEVRDPIVTDVELPDCLQYIPGTRKLAVVGLENRLRIWDTETGQIVSESDKYPAFFATLRVSPDGKRIAVCQPDGKIRLFRSEDLKELLTFDATPGYFYFDFSPDGNSLLVSGMMQPRVYHSVARKKLEHLSVEELRDVTCQTMSNIDRKVAKE